MTVAPGSRASSRSATNAVMVDGDTHSPRSSTTKQRSASPSKASPMSAPVARTAACRSRRFAGSMGLASWLGKDPSSSKYSGCTVSGSPSNTAGTVRPPMPLPASTTTRSGRMADRSTRVHRCSAYATKRSLWVIVPRGPVNAGIPASIRARMSPRPVSAPIGAAPARHSLTPLYLAGLWDAVNIAPGMSSDPAAK